MGATQPLTQVCPTRTSYHQVGQEISLFVVGSWHKSSLGWYNESMTQLKTIINNHMSLQCRCGHSKLVSVKELIGRLSIDATIYTVARKAKCSHCGTKGVEDFRLHYFCKIRD